MIVTIGVNEETPVFRIDEGDPMGFSYENLYKVVDMLACMKTEDKFEVRIGSELGDEQKGLANQYKELFEALYQECFKEDFREALEQSKKCEDRFEKLNSQVELSSFEVEGKNE